MSKSNINNKPYTSQRNFLGITNKIKSKFDAKTIEFSPEYLSLKKKYHFFEDKFNNKHKTIISYKCIQEMPLLFKRRFKKLPSIHNSLTIAQKRIKHFIYHEQHQHQNHSIDFFM